MAAPEVTDVIVVGAGLSGLTAARDVQRAGFSCIVLEAEDRVGGMTLSVKSNGAVIDSGAAWLNDSTQSHVWSLVQKYGLTPEVQNSDGELLREMQDGSILTGTEGNKKLTPEELKAMADFYGHVGKIVDSVDPERPYEHPEAAKLDGITLAQFCKEKSGNELVAFLLNSSVRYLLGAEADEISALWFFAYCKAGTGLQNMMSARKGGGQYLRLREGTQTIAQNLASELAPNTIRLSSPVSSVSHSPDGGCTITTRAGQTFRSTRAILSIPTSLHHTIAFTPALPGPKRALAASTRMGFFAKATLIYAAPWWRDHGLSAIFESALGPVIYSRATSIPATNHHSITGFIVGEPGRRWAKLSAQGRREAVERQLAHGFGEAIRRGGEGEVPPAPVRYVEEDWSARERFGGGPVPFAAPGGLTGPARGALAEPVGAVHFVGSETAGVWRGYMEGAVRSGIRGAEEVVAALKKKQAQGGKL